MCLFKVEMSSTQSFMIGVEKLLLMKLYMKYIIIHWTADVNQIAMILAVMTTIAYRCQKNSGLQWGLNPFYT